MKNDQGVGETQSYTCIIHACKIPTKHPTCTTTPPLFSVMLLAMLTTVAFIASLFLVSAVALPVSPTSHSPGTYVNGIIAL